MTDLALDVRNLGKRYALGPAARPGYRTLRDAFTSAFRRRPPAEPFWAVRDVSFQVRKGEVLGIVGRNGAGKSTLLKLLARITQPTEGEADIFGRVGSLLEVGTGFHPELTGRENVFLNGVILGMSRREVGKRFDAIVQFAEVEKFLDTPVKHYSSGMFMRLAFAVAAHLETEILIVDEVLAVGDAAFQKKCLGKMGEVATGGRTVLFVSHNLDAVAGLCRTGLLMRAGRVAAAGPAAEVLSAYLNEAAAATDGRFDLTAHPRRSRDHQCWLRAVQLRAADGTPTAVFRANDPVTVRLGVTAVRPVAEPRFAVAVEDSFGRRVFTVASYFQPGGVGPLTADAEVECRLPRLRLGTGRYLLSVSLAGREDGMLDSVDGCGWFDVEAHDPYGTGEAYHPVFGPVLEEAAWTRG